MGWRLGLRGIRAKALPEEIQAPAGLPSIERRGWSMTGVRHWRGWCRGCWGLIGGLPQVEATGAYSREAGTHFDPQVVEAFLRMIPE
jgi:hypothetical protein